MKMYILNMRTNQIIHTYKYLFGTRLVFIWQFINKSAKSMAFVFGGVQKHFESTHLSRHSTSSSLIVQNLITTQSMHHSLNPSLVTKLLLRYTSVISLVMRMYGPQYIDRVWRESPSSCIWFFDILHLNVTRMNHCRSFNTTWPEEVPIFTCGLRFPFS